MLDTAALDAIRSFERRQRFWPRFGLGAAGPDFSGQNVLEVGSGLGERCLDVAVRGARRVVGVDPFAESVTAARQTLTNYPALADVVEYRLCTVHDLAEGDFDAVVSENAFEHILDVPETLAAVRERLRPGGRAYIGFGPLYHGPFGDHGWMQKALPLGRRWPLPWGHVVVPHRWLLRRMERFYQLPVQSTTDWPFLTLNRKTVGEFRRLFRDCQMRTVYARCNANERWKGHLVGLIGRLPLLDKYFTLNMYYILEKLPG
jgi:SAM-dependent methyltransferase